ncbi:uncharacterized protein FIBRA_07398 [Fibroporia radiculosa]|uniref:RAVE complex protein Rav1 C-terminal domain-containing protein n=1 Tax=Fibroporia radiculosa TaxID=599839 RepID=J4H4L3_9APHY|nr:uncharacterized protein FIBRA_07398 [Fibroporia radiculosa]CCM05189.1 predicted protein [Fibroporia radiculosa]
MLELLQSYPGRPTSGLQFLALPQEILLLYPSADSIVVLNAHSLVFLRALAFWEAFPGMRHSYMSVQCLSIDAGMKLVVASMGARVAAWILSSSGSGSNKAQSSWRLHSSLALPEDQEITALDCKSGLLALGTRSTLSVYTLILENDLPTWSRKWACNAKQLARVRFSPSLMYIATTSSCDKVVRLHSTTSGRQTQTIPHPRPVIDINWRRPCLQIYPHIHTHMDDPIMYTTTSDGTLRIFLPVIDVPQRVQLHGALDAASSLPYSDNPVEDYPVGKDCAKSSSVFPLARDVVLEVLRGIGEAEDTTSGRRVREIVEEGWDLFLRVLADGSLVIQAVTNIDRRPPTLLRQFVLHQSISGLLPSPPPSHLYILSPLSNCSRPGTLTLITSPPLASYVLAPIPFLDSRADGLALLARASDQIDPETDSERLREVSQFVRTPEGDGVAALHTDRSVSTWHVRWSGRGLARRGRWDPTDAESVDRVVVLEGGVCFVTYTLSNGHLTLHGATATTIAVPSLVALFSLPSSVPSSTLRFPPSLILVGVTEAHTVLLISVSLMPTPSMSIRSETSLPLSCPLTFILPVDPMSWGGSPTSVPSSDAHDVLLSISEDGELAFWVPEDFCDRLPDPQANDRKTVSGIIRNGGWRCTGRVRTGRKGLRRAACSSAKKSVLVAQDTNGEELTIWDSKTSEFSSGLEYREVFSSSDPITDLDWTTTPDAQSVLAIGFAHRVELLSQQRMSYFDETAGWGRCWSIDIGRMLPHPIGDSIWLARGSLLIGAGHVMLLFGQAARATKDIQHEESLFEHVARYNGPLDNYHPQMILQCLLWEKVGLVKKIIINLAKHVESKEGDISWENIPAEEFYQKDEMSRSVHSTRKPQHSMLFSVPEAADESRGDQFSRTLVQRLLEHLEVRPLPHLTPNEHASLLVLIEATLEIEEQRRALDANGLRYLISMRTFYITNHRLSAPNTPASARTGAISRRIKPRKRLRYRDIAWAFHSESQELLLSTSIAACGGKMTWPDARALGVFLWMRSAETMKAHLEIIARNQYMAGDHRDPTACSLFYFALGKVKLVHGLWRQAAWHKEQAQMLKFLSNDFLQPRWRTAALKNAFALLSKRRFEYAAAFFLLGGSLKDAVNVCIKNLDDFQLAIALARIVEQGDEGPILREILNSTVLPLAFKDGNRWLASWAFWLLHRRDLAVRILVTPLLDIAAVLDVTITDIGNPHYDDPSLALLFSQLRSRTLQTAKGMSEISGRTEFNFVLQIARVFCRMGCQVLALDLVRTWEFQRPSRSSDTKLTTHPPSPVATRFAFEPALRRRSSILIDMDPSTAPPTRSASPISQLANSMQPSIQESVQLSIPDERPKPDQDMGARKADFGSLMKSAKQDAQVPEFDMSAFF